MYIWSDGLVGCFKDSPCMHLCHTCTAVSSEQWSSWNSPRLARQDMRTTRCIGANCTPMTHAIDWRESCEGEEAMALGRTKPPSVETEEEPTTGEGGCLKGRHWKPT